MIGVMTMMTGRKMSKLLKYIEKYYGFGSIFLFMAGIVVGMCLYYMVNIFTNCNGNLEIYQNNDFIEYRTANPNYRYVIDDISGIVYLKDTESGSMCIMLGHNGKPISQNDLEN